MNREEMLQKRIEELEKENRYLKRLLDDAGISYEDLGLEMSKDVYDENQGARIIHREITPEDANLFFSMFWGRTDVYSKRVVKKATGEVGYFPQCTNFWKSGCHRINGGKIKCKDCARRSYKKLERKQVIAHLKGESPNGTDVIGVYPLLADNTCRFIVFDFDNHEKNGEKCDFANTDNEWKEEVDTLRNICGVNGIDSLAERSRSGKGAHLWIFFQKSIEVALARKFGNDLLRKGEESFNLKSFRYYDRMLPMQDCFSSGGLGNLIALPLQGQALKEGNSAFIDENWNAYPNQWKVLFSKRKLSKEFIESKIKEWGVSSPLETGQLENNEKPWDKANHFMPEDVDGKMKIVLADGIYIDTRNLKPRIQNQIRRMSAFLNPVYFRNQVMGLLNFANARYIYLGKDENGYIKIPRALCEDLTAQCDKFNVKYEIEDNRCKGNEINVEFNGELRKSQAEASEMLLKYDCGILNAATAFGKTVVCCNIIAQKKVNTLIILQSSALME